MVVCKATAKPIQIYGASVNGAALTALTDLLFGMDCLLRLIIVGLVIKAENFRLWYQIG